MVPSGDEGRLEDGEIVRGGGGYALDAAQVGQGAIAVVLEGFDEVTVRFLAVVSGAPNISREKNGRK